MRIVIRVDAASAIGRGHVMRCLSLADGLRKWDNQAVFVCRELPGDLIGLLRSREYVVHTFCEGDDAQQTLRILSQLGTVDVLIVDHYGLDHHWEKKIRSVVSRLMVFDDLANRPHDGEILLDASFGRRSCDYQNLVPASCRLLLGPSYALLSAAYAKLRYSTLARRKKTTTVGRVLVSMGGTDPNNATGLVLDALSQVKTVLSVDVVVSSEWKYFTAIKEKIGRLHHDIQLHRDVTNLAELMSLADLAIGAGGVTSYERCSLGLPTILLAIADNQQHNAHMLHHQKAVKFLGFADAVAPEVIANAIDDLIAHPLEWQCMSVAAANVCDSYGVNRVVCELLLEDDALTLRPATFDDSDTMLKWQQDPSTRQFARNTKISTRHQHEQWLKQRLANPDCLFNMIFLNDRPVGVLRFDRIKNKDNVFEVSILVGQEHRQKGIARAALELSRKLYPNLVFYAWVHKDNKASHHLFQATGYVFEGEGYFNRGVVVQ